MKHFMYKKTIQKIVIVILTVLSLNFLAYPVSMAVDTVRDEERSDSFGGVLAFPIAFVLNAVADAANFLFQYALLGDDAVWPVMNGQDAVDYMAGTPGEVEYTKKAPDSNPDDAGLPEIRITRDALEPWVGNYDIGTIKMTPAEIFSGNVAALDANFFDTSSSTDDYDNDGKLGGESIVNQLKNVIAGWYVAIRNISIVGLLSVLIYLGIRMVISSSAGDKAKYKQFFMDWIIAFCLIFFLHYIMSFTMTISQAVTDMLAGTSCEDGTINQVIIQLTDTGDNPITEDGGRRFYSNFVNVARTKTQLPNMAAKFGYTFLYLVFTFFTVYFSLIYIKRLVMIAFLTMIAPFVALTYPIDKVRDGHAQAFNFWLKEYIFYAMLQPLHMLLYTVFVTSALEIAAHNMIYAVVAMAFIMPAEKIVKQMFNIHGSTEGNISGFAGGAIAGSLMNRLNRPPKQPKTGGNGGTSKPRIARNPSGISMNAALNTGSVPGGGTGTGGGVGAPATASTNGPTTVGATTTADGRTVYTANPHQGAGTAQYAGAFNNASMPGANTSSAGQGTTAGGRYASINGQNLHQSFTQRTGDKLKKAIRNGVNRVTPQSFKDAAGSLKNKINSAKNWAAQTKVGKVARAIKNSALGQAVGRRYKLAGGAGGIAKKALSAAARTYVRGAGMAAGVIVGGALGMVGDGPEGMLKGMAAGAAGGGALGNRLAVGGGNLINNTLSGRNALGSFAYEVNNGGIDEAERVRGENEYINDENNLARILQDNPDFSAQDLRDYARREYNMMYDSKTEDVDNAGKALDLEDAFVRDGMDVNEAHTRAAGILNATKSFDKSIFTNDKKLWEAEDAVVSNLMSQGMSQQEAIQRTDRTFQDLANLYGMGNQVNIQAKRAARNNPQARNNQPQNNQPQSGQNPSGQQTATRRINTTMNGRGSNRAATTQTVNPSQATTQNIPGPTTTTTTTVNTGGTTTTTTARTINPGQAGPQNIPGPTTTTTSTGPRRINTSNARSGQGQTTQGSRTTVNEQLTINTTTSRTINTTNARRPSTNQTQTTVEQTTSTEPRTINTGASRTGRTTGTNTVVNQTIEAPQTQETRTVNNVQTGASSRNIDVNSSQTINHQVVSGENTGRVDQTTSRTINTTNARRPSVNQTQTTVEQTTIEQTTSTEPRTINTGASRTGRTTSTNTVVNQTIETPQTQETRTVNNVQTGASSRNIDVNSTQTINHQVVSGENTGRVEQTTTTEPRTINTGASRTGRTTSTNTVVNQTIEAPQTQETRTVNNVQPGASSRNIDVNSTQTINHQVVSGENTGRVEQITSRTINTTNARRPSTNQTQTTVEQTTIEQTTTTEPRTINTGASRTGRTTSTNTVVNQTIEAPQTIETRGQTTTQVNNSRRRTIVENQVINDTETVDRGVEQTTTRRRTVQRQTQPQQQTTVVEHTTERVQQPKQPEQTVGRETKNETIVLRGRKIQRTTTRTTTTTGANSEQVRNKATIEDDNKDSLIDETIKRIKQHTDKRKLSRKKRDSNKNK